MYEYRKFSPAEQIELVCKRLKRGYPAHAPPHPLRGPGQYMITVACYLHQKHMLCENRREAFTSELLARVTIDAGGVLHAWVVLPNHYHLLWEGKLGSLEQPLRKLHSGVATQWNREDRAAGRQCWYRFTDRKIRSQAHYYASLNYIHANPVKHGWAQKADAWNTTSLHQWLQQLGRSALRDLWTTYPVDQYGEGWDD